MKKVISAIVLALLVAFAPSHKDALAFSATSNTVDFSFTDSSGSHSGSVAWSATGIAAANISEVDVDIYLPIDVTTQSAWNTIGESLALLDRQPVGTAKLEFMVIPQVGYSCAEAVTFTIGTYQAKSSGSCGTWDPANLPHFD
jgi:hypothetical protein